MSVIDSIKSAEQKASLVKAEAITKGKQIVEEATSKANEEASKLYDEALKEVNKMYDECKQVMKNDAIKIDSSLNELLNNLETNALKNKTMAMDIVKRRIMN